MKKFKATTQWTESVGVYEITLHTDMGPCYGCAIAMMMTKIINLNTLAAALQKCAHW